MNEQNKNPFTSNDSLLSTAKKIFEIGIPVCGIILFIIGFIFLFTEIFFLGFLIWILGGSTLFLAYIFIMLKIGYYRDVKLIRNKLYGIENKESTPSATHVITPENEYMAPYYK